MTNKKILAISCIAFSAVSLAMAQRTLFISKAGGNWSDSATWTTGSSSGTAADAPTAEESPINLRADGASGILTIDTDVTTRSASCWGKSQSIVIADGATWTIKGATDGSSGINAQSIVTSISGAGTLKGWDLTSTYKNTMEVYGGNKGTLNITSNANIDGVYFSGSNLTGKTTVTFNGAGTNKLYSSTHATTSDKLTDFRIYGKAGIETVVEFKGAVEVGDIRLNNNAKLVIDSSSFSLKKGVHGMIEVSKSTLELVGDKTSAYSVPSKVRLNGGSTMILTGNNAYTGLTNILFNDNTNINTIKVNGKTNLGGFCVYDNNSASAENTIRIELGTKQEGADYLLKLTHFTVVAGATNILLTDSLTSKNGAKNSDNSFQIVDSSSIFIEFVNFDNNLVKLDNDLLTVADWTHVKADGWENFRLENGFITADRVVVPEPAQWAMIIGSFALALVVYRKRR